VAGSFASFLISIMACHQRASSQELGLRRMIVAKRVEMRLFAEAC
jgi:hypothetical protein